MCQKGGKADIMMLSGQLQGMMSGHGLLCGPKGGPIKENSFVGHWGLTTSRDMATSHNYTLAEHYGGGNFDQTAPYEMTGLSQFWCH